MTEQSTKPQRYHEFDWLRAIVIINLIPFHVAWAMTFVPFFSQIDQGSISAMVLKFYVAFVSPLHMFLLFLISGTSTAIALRYRSAKQYILERIKRLFIPLVFFMLVLFPVLGNFWPGVERAKGLTSYFTEFWPSVLKIVFYDSESGGPQWAHMWFVAYLFIYSLIMLPVFLYLRKKTDGGPISGIASLINRKGGILLPALPLILVYFLMAGTWPFFQNNLLTDWGYFTYNFIAFVYGFLIISDERFSAAINKFFKLAFLLGVVFSIIKINMEFNLVQIIPRTSDFYHLVYSIIFGMNTWFWMVGILGWARKRLRSSSGFLKYSKRSSYPFYIFHLVIIVVLGFYVVRWNTGVILEFLILCILSFLVTLGLTEVVKTNKITGFLFGIKK
jgi:peptidoglycan/LPS O-acetylase OafA/YrhL